MARMSTPWLFTAVLGLAALSACSDRQPASPPASTTPPPATAPAPAPAPSGSSAPVIPPGTATDVESKKGTETGMIGGEAGTTASSGKPGTGTASGAGTGPAQSSGERTENKK